VTDIDRIDHAIIVTLGELDPLAAGFERLGFTVSPTSRHHANTSPGEPPRPLGTANRCIVFTENYLELLGIVDPDAGDEWGVRRMAAAYEGLRGQVLGTTDPHALDRRLTAAGVATSRVLTLERAVDTPAGPAVLRAEAVRLDLGEVPGEGGLAFGRIADRSVLFQPALMKHANGALGLAAITFVVADDELAHYVARYTTLLDVEVRQNGPRSVFALEHNRVEFVPESAMAQVLPGETAPVLPYVAAQTITVADLAAARALVEGNGVPTRTVDGGFLVGAAAAFGAATIFTASNSLGAR